MCHAINLRVASNYALPAFELLAKIRDLIDFWAWGMIATSPFNPRLTA